MSGPATLISSDWRSRLGVAFEGILTFLEVQANGGTLISGQSIDHSTVLEAFERNGRLVYSKLRIKLPDEHHDLVSLKIGYWTLLFFQALAPSWQNASKWVEEATGVLRQTGAAIHLALQGHQVSCSYQPASRVIDFHIAHA